MKRIVLAVSVVVLAFAVAILAQQKSGSAERELLKLENGWNEANLKRDIAFLDRILADDFTMGEFDGTVTTKAQLLGYLKSGEYAVTSAVYTSIKVRVYGDAAVVIGRTVEKSQFKGADASGEYLWTDTWVKIDNRWQCVANHGSKVAK
jgi:butyrate kinase